MKNFLSILICLSMIIYPSIGYTQQTNGSIDISQIEIPKLQLDEPNIGAAISPLKRNQRASFTGVLFSPEAISSVIVTYQNFPMTLKLETEKTLKTCKVEYERKLADQETRLTTDSAILNQRIKTILSENDSYKKIIKDYEDSNNSRLSTPTLLGLGVAGGIILTLGSVYLITSITHN